VGDRIGNKMKTIKSKIVVGIVILFLLGVYYLTKDNSQMINYNVEDCKVGMPSSEKFLINYDEKNKTLSADIWVNCCGVKVEVEKEDSTYKIIERQYGELCRCMCKKRVTIFNVPKNTKIVFLDKDGNSFVLTPSAEFCGWSTYGKCNSDKDCIKSGCSGEICQSRFEKPLITTCEWLDCYDAKKYKVACKCVNGRCQWVKILEGSEGLP